MVFCHKCGTKAIEGAQFCQKCGAKLINDDEKQPPIHAQQARTGKAIPLWESTPKPTQKSAEAQNPSAEAKNDSAKRFSTTVQAEAAQETDRFVEQMVASVFYPDPEDHVGPKPPSEPEPIVEPGPSAEWEHPKKSEEDRTDQEKRKNYRILIGKNWEYYYWQFRNVDKGNRSFNWCALLLGGIFLLYRKQFSSFIKLYVPYFVLFLVFYPFLLEDLYYAPGILTLGILFVLCIYSLAVSIYLGRNFNKLYKSRIDKEIAKRLPDTVDGQLQKKFKPSVVAPIVFCIVYGLLLSLWGAVGPSINIWAANLPVFNSTGDKDYSSEESDYPDELPLSQEYVNTEEGFSFRYPGNWKTEDPQDISSDTFVSVSYSSILYGVYARIAVTKYDASFYTDVLAATESDWAQVFSNNGINNVKISDLSDVMLGKYPARKVTITGISSDTDAPLICAIYFYMAGSCTYEIDSMCAASYADTYQPILDSIMETYTITGPIPSMATPSDTADKILFSGIPVQDVIEMSADDVIAAFGVPDEYTDTHIAYGVTEYEGWAEMDACFVFDDGTQQGSMVSCFYANPEYFSFNGQSLNREFDEVVDILGNDYTAQGGAGNLFEFTWYNDGCEIWISFPKFSEPDDMVISITVWPVGR